MLQLATGGHDRCGCGRADVPARRADCPPPLNAGTGFHSNDARGTVISVDPKSGDPADRVPGLDRAKGAEVGVRTEIVPRLQSTLSVYGLDFDSELIFEWEAGSTAAGRLSRRVGFEFSMRAPAPPHPAPRHDTLDTRDALDIRDTPDRKLRHTVNAVHNRPTKAHRAHWHAPSPPL